MGKALISRWEKKQFISGDLNSFCLVVATNQKLNDKQSDGGVISSKNEMVNSCVYPRSVSFCKPSIFKKSSH
jgi:hypothetical protein